MNLANSDLITGERLRLEKPEYVSIEKRSNTEPNSIRQIKSYPNPVNNNMLFLEVNERYEVNYAVDIVDLNGRLIKHIDFSSNNKLSISTDQLSSGVYILNISNPKEGIIHTDKIIIIE